MLFRLLFMHWWCSQFIYRTIFKLLGNAQIKVQQHTSILGLNGRITRQIKLMSSAHFR